MKTTNRGKSSHRRQVNNHNNAKPANDDDNCSVICYKDSDDGHVGVVRIRQQARCSACNLMRGTLTLYTKHLLENNHRENVRKLCEENRFVPSVYDQAIHLAFHNNFHYQSDKFHFVYKHSNEESDSSLSVTANDRPNAEITNSQAKNSAIRKRRSLQVTLVFQNQTYSRIGTGSAQIREQLLQDMIIDRAEDLAAIPPEIYYMKKKIPSDANHHNALKSSVISSMAKEQSQVMLKKQQSQESFKDGVSSAQMSREDNGVHQSLTSMTTDEISTGDDVLNVCKDVVQHILVDVHSQSSEFKREQQFLSGIARRSFKKKNTFICDICGIFLTSEKYCIQHLNSSEHTENICHYQTNFLPWRRAMQDSLVLGKPMKDMMGLQVYDEYKAVLAVYLAPNSLSNRGRFCCAYCELIFPDQWILEKHLHTDNHMTMKAASNLVDHKELVVRFANIVTLPPIFKFNGITQLSQIPDDIKTRYQWRCVTRAQLDENTNVFLRMYPLDACEGVTRLLDTKSARKQQKSPGKSSAQNAPRQSRLNHTQGRRSAGFARPRPTQVQTPVAHRGSMIKRAFPATAPVNKRFRGEMNNSFPVANYNQRPVGNCDINPYNYNPPGPYNNGNDVWPSRHPMDQRRQEFFERSNFELQSIATNNNGYYGDRPSQIINTGNNYHHEQQQPPPFNGAMRNYNNYDQKFPQSFANPTPDYHPEPNLPSLIGPPHRMNPGHTNERVHQMPNSRPPSQPKLPLMPPMHQLHHNTTGAFAGNHHNTNGDASFLSSNGLSQQNQMRTNGPPSRSYPDYRSSTDNTRPLMYQPSVPPQNPVSSQSRPFNDFALANLAHNSSNSYERSAAPLLGHQESRYAHFERQNQSTRSSWSGPSNSGNRPAHFQSMNKPAGVTFSYSSSNSNNNNNHNNSIMRGRGTDRHFGGNRPY